MDSSNKSVINILIKVNNFVILYVTVDAAVSKIKDNDRDTVLMQGQ